MVPTEHTFVKRMIIATIVLAVIMTVWGLLWLYAEKTRYSDIAKPRYTLEGVVIDEATFLQNEKTIIQVNDLIIGGRFAEAATIITKVLTDEKEKQTLTAAQLDYARRNLLSKYRATGNPNDSLDAVRELKKTVLDERMPIARRAESLSTLANSICWFGRSPEVLAAIFDEPPFDGYWHGDPTLANRDLLLLSYEKYTPTAKTASSLAYWYADQVILSDLISVKTKKLDKQTHITYVAEAKRYIAESEVLAAQEAKTSSKYTDSTRYIGYLYRRAFAIGALASVGELEKTDYQEAYALFHSEAARRTTAVSLQYTPFAHVLEARFEKNFGAPDSVVVGHLKAALAAIDSDPNPQSNEIVDFIRDKALDIEGRYSWHAIHQMRKELKEFDVFVETVELARRS